MTEEISDAVELTNFSVPPTIYTDDGIEQVEVFSASAEKQKLSLLYRKGFSNGKETIKAVELKVSGELPKWLSGEYFTVGPGTYDVKYNRMIETNVGFETGTTTFSMGHWFDGLPLVNRFALDGANNKINYRSKLTSKKFETKIREHHGIVTRHPFSLFKTHPNQTPLAKFLGKKRTNKPELESCSASINNNFPFSKPGEKPKIYCQNHAKLDAYDLTPLRVFSWDEIDPSFRGDHASPHSHFDETTGELINFNMEYHPVATKYNFFSISEKYPKGQLIASVMAKASYVHSFSVTPRFIILVIFPFYGKNAGINFKWSDNILDSFVFKPEEPTLFYVISREKKEHVAIYKSEAYEDNNLYLDIVCYDSEYIARYLTLENFRQGLPIRLPLAEVRRFALLNIQRESIKYLNNAQVNQSTMASIFKRSSVYYSQQIPHPWPEANYVRCSDSALELPAINPKLKRRKYRYVYGIGFSERAAKQVTEIWDSLIKNVKAVAMWSVENCYPSEPVFVPHPGQDNDEDDGVVLSVVFDGANVQSFLVVLDAKTMTELARVELPQVVPLSFGHGTFKETSV
ncbi:10665_t:CDS:2 [Diversispora eburnea]|uniref:10665_t:CDS:1 n=1 Tax=Diversispora eburnea TaxID=1213867 RepID=A0A9N8Z1G7_9GLOM|nr:10665_t:CDS:2 [Diversispora eburnea]